MTCAKCGHPLSREEIDSNLCWECGAIINIELVPDNKAEAKKTIASIEKAQKEQDKKQNQGEDEEAGTEYSVISAIHTFFSIVSILSVIGGIIAGFVTENFLVALLAVLLVSISYCIVRLLISIAYLLCDIKDNTSLKKKGK